ncbi:ester cyclase [Tardiphaga sp.]|uniref:ester cyclase n=1 Tax=Tardiphaga sp. TaxID=1926292 RepID=UPI0037DA5E7B
MAGTWRDSGDHTLPPGREQGPEGPAAASKTFLAAVPDVKATVRQRIVASDRVVSHIWFTDISREFSATSPARANPSTLSRPISCASGTARSPTMAPRRQSDVPHTDRRDPEIAATPTRPSLVVHRRDQIAPPSMSRRSATVQDFS